MGSTGRRITGNLLLRITVWVSSWQLGNITEMLATLWIIKIIWNFLRLITIGIFRIRIVLVIMRGAGGFLTVNMLIWMGGTIWGWRGSTVLETSGLLLQQAKCASGEGMAVKFGMKVCQYKPKMTTSSDTYPSLRFSVHTNTKLLSCESGISRLFVNIFIIYVSKSVTAILACIFQ